MGEGETGFVSVYNVYSDSTLRDIEIEPDRFW